MSVSDVIGAAPWSDHDPYTDEALLDPWPGYKQLRDAGPAVWLSKYDMFALTRYDSVRRALTDWESFPSRNGIMMNDQMNQVLRGNTLCSDGADHDALRDVLVRPLTPRALRPVREEITAEAERVVAKLVAHGTFDAATDLANHLPVTVVSNLVGLPEKGRERMLLWGEALFNCIGPMNDRTIASFRVLEEMMDYATNEAVPEKLKAGSWAVGIHDAVARGEVPTQACPAMMVDYMGPSLDTTICAISNAVWLFANNPEQWDLVRADPRLMPSAVNEVLRYDAPIQDFSRYVARDVDMDGVLLPAGSRAIVFYGAANRDERKYPDPDRFDVLRRPGDHLGFGAGPHACVGMNLAPDGDAGPVHCPGQANSALHHPRIRAAPEQCSARLQDVAGRRQLTWWPRDMRMILNSITPLLAAGTAAAATVVLSVMITPLPPRRLSRRRWQRERPRCREIGTPRRSVPS